MSLDQSKITYDAQGQARSFNGAAAVDVYRAAVIASALRLYAQTGMKANRAYTPTAMLKAANDILQSHFKRGQYAEAAEALSAYVQTMKAAIPSETVK